MEKSTNNELFAEYLSSFMMLHGILQKEYALIAGFCSAQITGLPCTDLDVILSKQAYAILSQSDETIKSVAEITKTPKLYIITPYGEIEFFEREHTGFPSATFSLTNLQNEHMLEYDIFGNPYLNRNAIVLHYSDVRMENTKLIIGEGHEITRDRLLKNIRRLERINAIEHDDFTKENIEKLYLLYNA